MGRLLWVVIFALGIGGDAGATDSLQAQRSAFQIAERSLQSGILVDYRSLRDYPLYPYLRYWSLARRLAELPGDEVREFLQTHADTPLADRLRAAWLRQLAGAQRWEDYLRDAAPSNDPTFECWRRQALLNTAQRERALHEFAVLWLQGRLLPNACDPVIAAWQAQGHLLPELRWQRFALAMNAGETGLARFLRKEMPATDQELADAWLAVAENPALILDAAQFKGGDRRIPAILADGLQRWTRRDALAAAAALDTLKQRDPALVPALGEAERFLALWIASDYHPAALARLTALPETAVDDAVREWRVRVCLRQGDWAGVLHWQEQMSAVQRESPRWRFWRGRALDALGRSEEARQTYQSIAGQRDYYSFLAAERLGVGYAIASTPLGIAPTELDTLLARSPGLLRARELYILGREPEADAEWRRAIQAFDRDALKQAALLAHRWGWHPQAIVTVARAEHWDDLELRFPMAYRDGVIASARAVALDPAWVYAVIRQESAFRADARSPVGALGLMQIMPATGQQIARELREPVAPDLLQPDTNIRYGVYYLQQILGQLQNHPLLATAAYNAGPRKVAQWLPEKERVPADVWAETIPYRETRLYVQRVMEYAAVYHQLLGLKDSAPLLSALMKPVLPQSAQPAS